MDEDDEIDLDFGAATLLASQATTNKTTGRQAEDSPESLSAEELVKIVPQTILAMMGRMAQENWPKLLTRVELKTPGTGHNNSLLRGAQIAYHLGCTPDATIEHLQSVYDPTRADHHSAPVRAVERIWEAKGDITELVASKIPMEDEASRLLPWHHATKEGITKDHIRRRCPHGKPETITPGEFVQAMFHPAANFSALLQVDEKGSDGIYNVEDIEDSIFVAKRLKLCHFLNPAVFIKDDLKELQEHIHDKEGAAEAEKAKLRGTANFLARPYLIYEYDSEALAKRSRWVTFRELSPAEATRVATGKGQHAEECAYVRELTVKEYVEQTEYLQELGQQQLNQANAFAFNILAKFIPLAAVVDSGGKSLHFWFRATKDGLVLSSLSQSPGASNIIQAVKRQGLFTTMVAFGCDRSADDPVKVMRMPNVSASKISRKKQRLIYFDPDGENYPTEHNLLNLEAFYSECFPDSWWHSQEFAEKVVSYKSKTYILKKDIGWIQLSRDEYRDHLTMSGYTAKAPSEITPRLVALAKSKESQVDTVFNYLSGYSRGVHLQEGKKFLVCKHYKRLRAKRGKWEHIKAFLEGYAGYSEASSKMRDPDAETQLQVLLGQLQSFVLDFRNGGERVALARASQLLIQCGPSNAGKSFARTVIFALLNDGSQASVDHLLCPAGVKTANNFNADTSEAGFGYVDDSGKLSPKMRDRIAMGETLKSLLVSMSENVHSKGNDAINISPWRRYFAFINPSLLNTMPPLIPHMEDKLVMLKVYSMDGGPLKNMVDMSKANWSYELADVIRAELPAFLHYLTYYHQVPEECMDAELRYPTISYHNPQLVDEIVRQSSEYNIFRSIQRGVRESLLSRDRARWSMNPVKVEIYDLYERLTTVSVMGDQEAVHQFKRSCPDVQSLTDNLRILEALVPGVHNSKSEWATNEGFPEMMATSEMDSTPTDYWLLTPRMFGADFGKATGQFPLDDELLNELDDESDDTEGL